MRPKVTAVIPAYNAASTIATAVRSVLEQSGVSARPIVVDDGSTDDTVLIAESLGDAVEVVRSQHRGLPGVCRNVGIRLARSRFVAFLDADDEWLPGKLRLQCAMMDADERLALVCSNAWRRRGDDAASDSLYFPEGRAFSGPVLGAMIRENPVITSTALVRVTALQHAGVFREDESVPAVEDYDLWLRLALHYHVASVAVALAIYRDQPGSYRSTVSDLKEINAVSSIMTRLRAELPKGGREREAAGDRIAGLSREALGLLEGFADARCAARYAHLLLRERWHDLDSWRSVGGYLKRSTHSYAAPL